MGRIQRNVDARTGFEIVNGRLALIIFMIFGAIDIASVELLDHFVGDQSFIGLVEYGKSFVADNLHDEIAFPVHMIGRDPVRRAD
jgi:hypothetical protein